MEVRKSQPVYPGHKHLAENIQEGERSIVYTISQIFLYCSNQQAGHYCLPPSCIVGSLGVEGAFYIKLTPNWILPLDSCWLITLSTVHCADKVHIT